MYTEKWVLTDQQCCAIAKRTRAIDTTSTFLKLPGVCLSPQQRTFVDRIVSVVYDAHATFKRNQAKVKTYQTRTTSRQHPNEVTSAVDAHPGPTQRNVSNTPCFANADINSHAASVDRTHFQTPSITPHPAVGNIITTQASTEPSVNYPTSPAPNNPTSIPIIYTQESLERMNVVFLKQMLRANSGLLKGIEIELIQRLLQIQHDRGRLITPPLPSNSMPPPSVPRRPLRQQSMPRPHTPPITLPPQSPGPLPNISQSAVDTNTPPGRRKVRILEPTTPQRSRNPQNIPQSPLIWLPTVITPVTNRHHQQNIPPPRVSRLNWGPPSPIPFVEDHIDNTQTDRLHE